MKLWVNRTDVHFCFFRSENAALQARLQQMVGALRGATSAAARTRAAEGTLRDAAAAESAAAVELRAAAIAALGGDLAEVRRQLAVAEEAHAEVRSFQVQSTTRAMLHV